MWIRKLEKSEHPAQSFASNGVIDVFNGKLILHRSGETTQIELFKIRKIFVEKKRDLKMNSLVFFLIIIVYCKMIYSNYSLEIILNIWILILVLVLFLLFIKCYNYKIIILLNQDLIKMKISKKQFIETKSIINNLQQYIDDFYK